MLTHLSIRDVVLVEKLEIDFAAGLCVLTGETGAGKSIVLDALGLALGGRADATLIRGGADGLNVSAVFTPPVGHPAFALLADQGLAAEDDSLVLRRNVGRDGRSRAFVNDQPVSVGFLRQIGACLVEVHGQFDTHGLLDPANHVAALDAYRRATAGDAADAACAQAWTAWRAAADALATAQSTLAAAMQEEDLLRHNVAELDRLAPKPGEEAALADARALLRHAELIMAAVTDARAVLAESADVEGALRSASTKLARVAAQAAGRLDATLAALDRAAIETAEATAELDRVVAGFDVDPAELERAEERLFALKAAARKYGCAVADLPGVAETLKARLSAIDGGAARVQALATAEQRARQDYVAAAKALTAARTKAAKQLDERVAKELPPLKLEKAAFHTAIAARPEAAWGAAGVDQVAFEVATNPGMPPGPLAKIASGGELARFMLALKVVLAGTQARATLIFDEVDAGISGATANAVGERLARLARTVQVLVVTHAPQVAARGNAHWRVTKTSRAGHTTTKVERLSDAARREEIARMLAGEKVTDEARAAADSLLSGPLS
jgi:DNA repair protein RecN (Recombination protein N)